MIGEIRCPNCGQFKTQRRGGKTTRFFSGMVACWLLAAVLAIFVVTIPLSIILLIISPFYGLHYAKRYRYYGCKNCRYQWTPGEVSVQ